VNSDTSAMSAEDAIPVSVKLSPGDEAQNNDPASDSGHKLPSHKPEVNDKPEVHASSDQSKLMYDAWLEEYRSLRAEVIAIGTSSRQGTQVAIVALAAVISLAGYIVQNDLPILFLLAPLVFYALAWTQLRLAYTARTTSDYIIKNLAKNVVWAAAQANDFAQSNSSIGMDYISLRDGDKQRTCRIFGWEAASRQEMHSHKKRLRLIEASVFTIPVAVAFFLPGGYFSYVSHYHAQISKYAISYIFVNEVLCVYTLMIGSWIRRFSQSINDPINNDLANNNRANRVPNRFSDLIGYQLMHIIILNWHRFSPYVLCVFPSCSRFSWFSSAISEGSRSLDWYDKEVPKSTMT
jgi:hypothetical protein